MRTGQDDLEDRGRSAPSRIGLCQDLFIDTTPQRSNDPAGGNIQAVCGGPATTPQVPGGMMRSPDLSPPRETNMESAEYPPTLENYNIDDVTFDPWFSEDAAPATAEQHVDQPSYDFSFMAPTQQPEMSARQCYAGTASQPLYASSAMSSTEQLSKPTLGESRSLAVPQTPVNGPSTFEPSTPVTGTTRASSSQVGPWERKTLHKTIKKQGDKLGKLREAAQKMLNILASRADDDPELRQLADDIYGVLYEDGQGDDK
jgi:hypothetical protein